MTDRRRPLALVMVLAVAGCSSSGSTTAAPTRPTAGPTVASTAAPTAAPTTTGPYLPQLDLTAFGSTVDNPYFPLWPGTRWEYRSKTPDGVETTVVEVTTATRTILGVRCVEVRDTVRLDGEITEDTRDWYARQRDGTVWYFGEDTKEYEDGKVVTTKGSWQAGVDGAQPGVIMPAQPRVGDRYQQEYYPGEAEDAAEVLALSEHVQVPAGGYESVVVTRESTRLEPGLLERKYYAPGVGPVLTVDSDGIRDELIRFTPGPR